MAPKFGVVEGAQVCYSLVASAEPASVGLCQGPTSTIIIFRQCNIVVLFFQIL